MKTFYFTCGQSHRHDIGGGRIWNCNNVLAVNADNELQARGEVCSFAGLRWSMVHESLESVDMQYYPGGIVATITAKAYKYN